MKSINPDYTFFCSKLKMFTSLKGQPVTLEVKQKKVMHDVRYAMPRYPTGEEMRRKFGSGYPMEW